MSDIWFTSDLHVGHRRVATEFRPFSSVEEHDQVLAERWRDTVGKRDTVYVLGDLCVSGLDTALSFVSELPGTKHFISGNHDGCHPMHRKWRSLVPKFETVFATVQPFGSVRIDGSKVLLSHFPYSDDHVVPARYMQYRLPDLGEWLLHGHTHDAGQQLHGHEIHVGVDAWDFAPVSINTIQAMMG